MRLIAYEIASRIAGADWPAAAQLLLHNFDVPVVGRMPLARIVDTSISSGPRILVWIGDHWFKWDHRDGLSRGAYDNFSELIPEEGISHIIIWK